MGLVIATTMAAASMARVSTAQSTLAAAETPCRTIAPDAMDGPIASPENHTILYENADVRVLEVHSQPHTREAVHTHARPAVMYIDRQGAGTYKTPDGSRNTSHPTDPNFKPRIIATKPEEGPHWTENTGEVPFHAIRVEFKHPGCGLPGWKAAAPGPDDALVAAPATHSLLLENDDVRVLDVHLAPRAQEAYHTHPWPGVFYVVQAAPLRHLMKGSSVPQMRTFPAGVKILPAPAEGHTIENAGDVPLHLIRFELKYGTLTGSSAAK